jgi:hypothetical protein
LVFNNQSASVQFPGTLANYGTGSFTVEMAFRPDQINGIHYLVSKNSGSFPNWGVYLSGSAGSGKLFSFYNISSTVSCSVSSSSTFVTGSNYFVDVQFQPSIQYILSIVNNTSFSEGVSNGIGSLSNTGSFLVGNTPTNTQAFSGSLYTLKTYASAVYTLKNYLSISTRLQLPVIPSTIPNALSSANVLIVAGGGGGNQDVSGGGGAGGLLNLNLAITPGTYTVFVGDGGASGVNGQTSSFSNYSASGGGRGGSPFGAASSGGSGGGGGYLSASSGSGIAEQGSSGGTSAAGFATAGGGGAGSAGGNHNAASGAGFGGSGSFYPQFISVGGSPAGWFAGGGGGGYLPSNATNGGIGGGGGGGVGSVGTGRTGSRNTGGGGGGGSDGNGIGGKGGSGVVIIRYPGSPVATGGTITTIDYFTYHTFTATGSSTFTVL